MRARAVVRAVADGPGTALAELRGEAPVGLRRGPCPAPGWAQVWMVGSAGGPLGGDDVEVRIEVGPGAALAVGSVAASVALAGASPSVTRVRVVVASGGSLVWAPEPLIVTGRADHRVDVVVVAAPDAFVWWRDELVSGRTGERPGRCTLTLHADLGAAPWVRHELAVGGRGWDGAAVVGTAKLVGSVLTTRGDGPRAASTGSADRASVDRGPASTDRARRPPEPIDAADRPGPPPSPAARPAAGRVAELRPQAGGTLTLALADDRVVLGGLLPAHPLPPLQRSHHVAC